MPPLSMLHFSKPAQRWLVDASNKLSTVASFSQSPFIVIQKLLETRASPAPWIAAITSVFIHDNDELYSECLSETIIRSSYHVDCVS